MRLIVAHKILISGALFLCASLLVRGIRLYGQSGSTFELLFGLASGVVGAGLVVYLRYIWKK
jgi:hypothetical protein